MATLINSCLLERPFLKGMHSLENQTGNHRSCMSEKHGGVPIDFEDKNSSEKLCHFILYQQHNKMFLDYFAHIFCEICLW